MCKAEVAWSSGLVLELAGNFPSSICSVILANFGANVVHVTGLKRQLELVLTKHSMVVNLKTSESAVYLKKIYLQSEVSQKDKNRYCVFMHIYGI